jgi:energy-coupling factor transport system permease protein
MLWLTGVLVVLSVTRNPLYLALALGCVGVTLASLRRASESLLPMPVSPVRFGLLVVALSALFNAATAHVGRGVLVRLPEVLPLIGGPVTLEALVFGALNGLVLTGIYTAFVVLNQALPVRSLVRFIPRAFSPVAVVVSIALSFAPTTLRNFQQIREAQAIRGHRVRGLRDWLPLFLPLLVGGLKRALQLAEAMTARGFASTGERIQTPGPRLVIVAGLIALLIGWLLRLVWRQEAVGLALMVLGGALVVAALWIMGRRVPRTTYRVERWQVQDSLVILGAAVATAAFLVALPGLDRRSIFYYPYPALSWPRFDPLIGVALLGLLVPAALRLPTPYSRFAVCHER